MKKTDDNGIITQTEAARRAGISKQRLRQYMIDKKPKFIYQDPVTELKKINTKHKSWIEFEKKNLLNPKRIPVKKASSSGKSVSKKAFEKRLVEKLLETVGDDEQFNEVKDLAIRAERALREQEISKAEIAKQKAMQEEIKTLELKKHTAPIELLDFFFSFAENMIQRIYRRPGEIEADLETLFMGGEKKKATQKLIREFEAIVKDVQTELIAKLKAEGFKLDDKRKK
jgi:hypothetical protein